VAVQVTPLQMNMWLYYTSLIHLISSSIRPNFTAIWTTTDAKIRSTWEDSNCKYLEHFGTDRYSLLCIDICVKHCQAVDTCVTPPPHHNQHFIITVAREDTWCPDQGRSYEEGKQETNAKNTFNKNNICMGQSRD
jgi:hypothetical protein